MTEQEIATILAKQHCFFCFRQNHPSLIPAGAAAQIKKIHART